MKTSKILLLGVAAAVILTADKNLWAADGTGQLAKIKQNSALAHSPRMIELFPELAFSGAASTTAGPKPDTRANKIAEISKNLSLANSPRMREQFPELAFSEQTLIANSSKSAGSTSELAKVMQNQSLAQSPRMIERFPVLAFKNNGIETNLKSVEVAPLK
jgi:hypothetical protein